MNEYKIIDAHVHYFPEKIERAAINKMEKTSGLQAPYKATLNALKSNMQKHGISKAILLPVATHPDQVRSINSHSPFLSDSLESFAAYHPDVEDIQKTIKHIVAMGYKGLKLHPEYQSFTWKDRKIQELCEEAQKHKLVIYTHSGRDVSFKGVQTGASELSALADNFPALKIVSAHYGGFLLWEDTLKYLAGKENIYLDTAFTFPYIDRRLFLKICKKHGVDHIIFGTDYPWRTYDNEFYHLKKLFNRTDLKYIFGKNINQIVTN